MRPIWFFFKRGGGPRCVKAGIGKLLTAVVVAAVLNLVEMLGLEQPEVLFGELSSLGVAGATGVLPYRGPSGRITYSASRPVQRKHIFREES